MEDVQKMIERQILLNKLKNRPQSNPPLQIIINLGDSGLRDKLANNMKNQDSEGIPYVKPTTSHIGGSA